jgi:hypothetical protein
MIEEVRLIFSFFLNDINQMNYVSIAKEIDSKSQIFKSICLNMMRVNRWNLSSLFQNVKQDENETWSLEEFVIINEVLYLGFSYFELKEAFLEFTS